MICCILAETCSLREKVWMAISLPLARAVICVMFACIAVPSNFAHLEGFGFSAFTTMGTAVSTIMGVITGSCAAAGAQHTAASARSAGSPVQADFAESFIPYRPWQFARI